MKPTILVVVGPTAVGKSDLAVILAKKFNGEVISADSRQVYKGLTIGTGKITTAEMKGITHHLLSIADPKKVFTVEDFKVQASEAIRKVLSKGKLPILCGGSGFYIDAVINSAQFPSVKANKKLRAQLKNKTALQLLALLHTLDSKRAQQMKKSNSERNNSQRLIRAIEIAKTLGSVPAVSTSTQFNPIYIGLNLSSENLRARIHSRLLKRMAGMISEAKRLHSKGLSWKRMNELGLEYRYLASLLQEKLNREQVIEKLSVEIWRYAKRQMVWFKRNKKITWFDPADRADITAYCKSQLF